jgi:PAS domain S-box-containing protein
MGRYRLRLDLARIPRRRCIGADRGAWRRHPILVVSSDVGEEIAVAAIKAGAHDFVGKHNLTRLVPALARELRAADDRRERRRAERALSERLDLAVAGSKAGFWDWVLRDQTSEYAPSWRRLLGYKDGELADDLWSWFNLVHPDDRGRLAGYVERYVSDPSSPYEIEFRVRHKDGTYRWVLSRAIAVADTHGTVERMLGLHFDITDRKHAEQLASALARVAQEIMASLDTAGLLDRLCRLTCEALGCDWSHAWLLRPEGDAFVLRAAYGHTPAQHELTRVVTLSRSAVVDAYRRLDRVEVVELGHGGGAHLAIPPAMARTRV